MKKLIYILIFLFSVNTLQASGTLTIEHATEGGLTGEITSQLPEGTELSDYASLIINGASLNINDCNTITERLPHLVSIDFSNTSFKDNTIPFYGNEGPENGTFSSLTSLETITFPDNLEIIGDYTFSKCTALRNIEFGSTSQLQTIGKHAFNEATSLANPVFPANLSLIQEYAFYQCTAINRLTLPQGLTEIEDYAFHNCTGLTDVDAPWETPITVGAESFNGAGSVWNDQKEIILHVPNGTADLYRATNWDKLTIEEEIGTGVSTEVQTSSNISFDFQSKLATINATDNGVLKIVNIKGETVLQKTLTQSQSIVDLSTLNKGFYLIYIGEDILKILR